MSIQLDSPPSSLYEALAKNKDPNQVSGTIIEYATIIAAEEVDFKSYTGYNPRAIHTANRILGLLVEKDPITPIQLPYGEISDLYHHYISDSSGMMLDGDNPATAATFLTAVSVLWYCSAALRNPKSAQLSDYVCYDLVKEQTFVDVA